MPGNYVCLVDQRHGQTKGASGWSGLAKWAHACRVRRRRTMRPPSHQSANQWQPGRPAESVPSSSAPAASVPASSTSAATSQTSSVGTVGVDVRRPMRLSQEPGHSGWTCNIHVFRRIGIHNVGMHHVSAMQILTFRPFPIKPHEFFIGKG